MEGNNLLKLVLLTAALTVLAVPGGSAPGQQLLLHDYLNGTTAGASQGLEWVDGVEGQAARLDSPADGILYPADAFAERAGRIELDLRLNADVSKPHPAWTLLSDIGAAASHPGAINVLWREDSGALEYAIFDGGQHHWCISTTTEWEPGRWYHIALTYGPEGMSLEVDGKVEARNTWTGGLASTGKQIGWDDAWNDAPPVDVDNLRTTRSLLPRLEARPEVIYALKAGGAQPAEIEYELPEDALVRLDVLDESSRMKKRLVDRQNQQAGEHQLSWDGSGLPDGVYTLSLIAESDSGSFRRDVPIAINRRHPWAPRRGQLDRFFPTGVWYFWESNATYINQQMDDERAVRAYYEQTLQQLADHNVNLVVANWTPPQHRKMMLDIADRLGIRVIVHLSEINSAITGTAHDRARMFDVAREAVEQVGRHPAAVGYYIIDEPSNTPEMAGRIRLARVALEAIDPERPAFSCLLGSYEKLLETVDYRVLVIDLYPVGPNWNGDWSGYIAGLQRGQANAGDRPLWVILQAFGKPGSWKVPEPEEIRAQVWMALAHGAKGIIYFIYQSTTGIQGEWLQGMVDMDLNVPDGRLAEAGRLNSDIQILAPVLMRLKPTSFDVPDLPEGVLAKPFTDGSSRYLFLVNTNTAQSARPSLGALRGTDVLSSTQVREAVDLQPGGGRLLRLE